MSVKRLLSTLSTTSTAVISPPSESTLFDSYSFRSADTIAIRLVCYFSTSCRSICLAEVRSDGLWFLFRPARRFFHRPRSVKNVELDGTETKDRLIELL